MAVSIVIQRQEDWPGNPGWWRYGRPRHEVHDHAPQISESHRWYYGNEQDAQSDAAEWDRTHQLG